ncbi:MAG: terminase family protein [Gammaproteobacteria bacterium]|nr:terminase family protein [Gammaproteobacteria bacterium]
MSDQDSAKRLDAKYLFWQGFKVSHISKKLSINAATIYSWKRRDEWDSTPEIKRVEFCITTRLSRLVAKDEKTEGDLREIEMLIKGLKDTARIRSYDQAGNEADLNPNIKKRNEGKKKKPVKNYLSEEQVESLVDAFHGSLFKYQQAWNEARKKSRIRNILKSRQIGATWYFAREAIVDAVVSGDNQIFLSASKAQAYIFKLYILAFVKEVTGVELSGDPITLWNGATLYFLGTNIKTAQGYHGHVYMDEYFWIGRFEEFRKVASGMAMHRRWRQTYFSTPSSVTHEAHQFWTGKRHNKGKPKEQQINIDVSHKALKAGRVCEDGQWRQIVTVLDAMDGGCDLFDLDQLKLEYSDDEFANLLMCEFIDDSISVFSLPILMRCQVDAWVVWEDIKPLAPRPFGNRRVWLGYDPSRTRDDAVVAVIAPPVVTGGKFRLLEVVSMRGLPFPEQARKIRTLVAERYNVERISVDITGIGYGVFDLVQEFFPAAQAIKYSPEVKTRLVLKTLNIINGGLLEYDAGDTTTTQAFLSVRKTMTPTGNTVTYEAARSENAGHGDNAWAIMHALDNEQLRSIDLGDGGGNNMKDSIVEIF